MYNKKEKINIHSTEVSIKNHGKKENESVEARN